MDKKASLLALICVVLGFDKLLQCCYGEHLWHYLVLAVLFVAVLYAVGQLFAQWWSHFAMWWDGRKIERELVIWDVEYWGNGWARCWMSWTTHSYLTRFWFAISDAALWYSALVGFVLFVVSLLVISNVFWAAAWSVLQ